VADIRAKARGEFVEKCVEIVSGKKLATFGRAFEDWVLFNSFFRNSSFGSKSSSGSGSSSIHGSSIYGSGFYVDVSDKDPVSGSPAFFFDACLGWEGLCVPTSGSFQEAYKKNRTCKAVPLGSPPGGGNGSCSLLEEVLMRENVQGRRIDLVTLMWESAPLALRCFPFQAFGTSLWNVQAAPNDVWGWKKVDLSLGAAGFWKAPPLMAELNTTQDAEKKGSPGHGNLPRHKAQQHLLAVAQARGGNSPPQGLTVPTMVIGPLYRQGQPLYRSAFPACNPFAGEGTTPALRVFPQWMQGLRG